MAIEKKLPKEATVTGAQSYYLMGRLRARCDKPLQVQDFPATAKVADRKRASGDTLERSDIAECVQIARRVFKSELTDRFFGTSMDDRPSQSRLVQIYMSKQARASSYLPAPLVPTAKAAYRRWLLGAAEAIKATLTPQRSPRKHARSPQADVSFYDSPCSGLGNVDEEPNIDRVDDEINRWAELSTLVVSKHRSPRGLIDEFALHSDMKSQFPLHHFVFCQTAGHMPHEGNTESFFSLCKKNTDPNMHPGMLQKLSKIGANKAKYDIPIEAIKERYYKKFGKNCDEDFEFEV